MLNFKCFTVELEYVKVGDYLYPALEVNSEPEEPLTKYGLMRKNFLKEHRRGTYTGMMLEGELKEHCLKIQKQAEERMKVLVEQMMRADEQMKAVDQMRWVRMMNSIRERAEEIVRNEIIFV